MERITQTLLVKKYTLIIDELWEKEILTKMWPYVEAGEVLQLLDEESIEICDDCQSFLTKEDGEIIMDVYRCDAQQEFCLNCCGCPEHEGPYYE
jgi:hypothetical protein